MGLRIRKSLRLTTACTLGFYRGFSGAHASKRMEEDQAADKAAEAARFSPDRPPPSLPPGSRAEGGEVVLPAAVYRQHPNGSGEAVAMLDGTPITRPLSQTSGSSSKFREHIAEMEDTSAYRQPPQPVVPAARSPKTPDNDSPTLGRDSGVSPPSLADQVRRKQHLMSWNSYDSESFSAEQPMGATMAPKSPPGVRSPEQVSPDRSNTPIDRSFIVSPMNSLDLGRRDGR